MTTPDFAGMVPGFDFLQNLLKSAGSSLPGIGQWIAPTLDAEEVDKRIQELRTVQFWLEQNARMLAATIQALEVQRMTLATLRTMNVPMHELRESMKIDPGAFASRPPRPAAGPASAPAAAPAPAPAPAPMRDPAETAPTAGAAEADADASATASPPAGAATGAPPAADPLQWWGALTRQFTELATKAMQDMPAGTASAFAKAAASAARDTAAPTPDAGSGKAAAAKKRPAAAERASAARARKSSKSSKSRSADRRHRARSGRARVA